MNKRVICMLAAIFPLYAASEQEVVAERMRHYWAARNTAHSQWYEQILTMCHSRGNVYDPVPTDPRAPLSEDLVLNPYWRKIKESSEREKAAELQDLEKSCPPFTRTTPLNSVVRYHLAAAILMQTKWPAMPFGTHVNRGPQFPQTHFGAAVLGHAVYHEDFELAKLLLHHGANPNAETRYEPDGGYWPHTCPPDLQIGGRSLFLTKNMAMIQLLVGCGAFIDVSLNPYPLGAAFGLGPRVAERRCASLLDHACETGDLNLVSFYRDRETPGRSSAWSRTQTLALWLRNTTLQPDDVIMAGVDLLLANISPAEVRKAFFRHNFYTGEMINTFLLNIVYEVEGAQPYLPYSRDLFKRLEARLAAAAKE